MLDHSKYQPAAGGAAFRVSILQPLSAGTLSLRPACRGNQPKQVISVSNLIQRGLVRSRRCPVLNPFSAVEGRRLVRNGANPVEGSGRRPVSDSRTAIRVE